MRGLFKSVWAALIAFSLLAAVGTVLYAQDPVRSRAEETLEWWNHVGNKLIAMAKDFPEDKYDFKVQKDERTFAENLLHVAAIDYDLVSRVSGSHVGPDFGKDIREPVARGLQDQSGRGETG